VAWGVGGGGCLCARRSGGGVGAVFGRVKRGGGGGGGGGVSFCSHSDSGEKANSNSNPPQRRGPRTAGLYRLSRRFSIAARPAAHRRGAQRTLDSHLALCKQEATEQTVQVQAASRQLAAGSWKLAGTYHHSDSGPLRVNPGKHD